VLTTKLTFRQITKENQFSRRQIKSQKK